MGIENAELAEFADSLWENYMKFRNKEADAEKVSFYKAKVTANPGGGYLTIKKPFDAIAYNVACPSYMAEATVGLQVLVLRFGNGTSLKNHFVIDNAARTMLASAIATGSSITFPISVANGGTGATTLAGAKSNLEIPSASDANPVMNGTADAGELTAYSRADHVHPADTSKADKSTTVTNVSYDSSAGKLQQTINGVTTDIMSISSSGGSYVYTQAIAASTWTINHNLGYYPSVTVVDSAGNVVSGDTNYTSENQVVVTFNGSFSGEAYLS